MALNVSGLSHIALRVTDLARAKAFYTEKLGFQIMIDTPGLVLVSGYGILLGMRGDDRQTPAGDRFSPYRVGLDHLALAVSDRTVLASLKDVLDGAGIRNQGIEEDEVTHAPFISFADPDGIAWEFYVLNMPQG
ncbi:MAG: VOC family protein [Herpetosiphon sp.]